MFKKSKKNNKQNLNKLVELSKQKPFVSLTYEEMGLFPRSFNRVFDRLMKQIFSDVENLVIQEYRFYRYLFLTTIRCLCILVFVPFFVNYFAKIYIVRPMTEYYWNTQQLEIFLNSYQQKRAFSELLEFEEILYFESLIEDNCEMDKLQNVCQPLNNFQQRLENKTLELAIRYNEQSIEAITNFIADLLSFSTLCFLIFSLEVQINITKSFLLEVFFGLDDMRKSLLMLFVTDLLVGYHSPNIWELFFSSIFSHYGLPESEISIFLLVATLPVLLDVLFKYLIFRHLNRASPATVATYHALIE